MENKETWFDWNHGLIQLRPKWGDTAYQQSCNQLGEGETFHLIISFIWWQLTLGELCHCPPNNCVHIVLLVGHIKIRRDMSVALSLKNVLHSLSFSLFNNQFNIIISNPFGSFLKLIIIIVNNLLFLKNMFQTQQMFKG